MNTNKIKDYYQRQTVLDEVGDDGQNRLNKSKVLVIGAGGLGCPALQYLAAAGCGYIEICDFDKIDYSNLHRQILYTPENVGQYKADIAMEKLTQQNPHIIVKANLRKFDLDFLIDQFDLVLDCSDNFRTKFIAHDLCLQKRTPLIQASIHKFEGQLQVFHFDKSSNDTPCLRCLWPKTPKKTCVQTCSEAGVLGLVPGVIGCLQASEAIKYLLSLTTLNTGETLIINLLNFSTHKIKWPKDKNCSWCSSKNFILENLNYGESPLEIDFPYDSFKSYVVINLADIQHSLIKNPVLSNMRSLKKDTEHLQKNTNILVCCKRGITSLKGTELLREIGFTHSFSLKNGINNL